jgi:hypothetical protein
MRLWQFWWHTFFLSTQHNPAQSIERMMLVLSIVLMSAWLITDRAPYAILAVGYTVGSAASMWVQELLSPIRPRRVLHASMLLALTLMMFAIYVVELIWWS